MPLWVVEYERTAFYTALVEAPTRELAAERARFQESLPDTQLVAVIEDDAEVEVIVNEATPEVLAHWKIDEQGRETR